MKLLFALLAALSCSAASAQDAQNGGQTPTGGPTPPAGKAIIPMWVINPMTWELVAPDSAPPVPLELNTPAQIEKRRLAALVLLAPDVYFGMYPKTTEQLNAEKAALQSVLHPKTRAEEEAGETPEQIAARRQALEALFQKGSPVTLGPGMPAAAGTNQVPGVNPN